METFLQCLGSSCVLHNRIVLKRNHIKDVNMILEMIRMFHINILAIKSTKVNKSLLNTTRDQITLKAYQRNLRGSVNFSVIWHLHDCLCLVEIYINKIKQSNFVRKCYRRKCIPLAKIAKSETAVFKGLYPPLGVSSYSYYVERVKVLFTSRNT